MQLNNIVVAGSAGKTSVKELICVMLNTWSEKSFVNNPENHNTRIALATQILRLDSRPDLGVFEIGARHTGDLKFPLQLLNPKVALLLNIGTAHLGEFGSIENLIKEKLSVLFSEGLELAIINGDDERILKAAEESKKSYISFGYGPNNHVQVLKENGSEISYRVGKKNIVFNVNLQTPSFSLNLAAVLALAEHLQIPFSVVQTALMSFHGVKRRFEIHIQQNTQVIDDAFNASPESMYLGLKKVAEIGKDKSVLLILGSMKELGSETAEQHRKVAAHIHILFAEHIRKNKLGLIFVGEESFITFEEIKRLSVQDSVAWMCFQNSISAKKYLDEVRFRFEIIYLKGSKSTQLEVLVG